MNHWSIKTLYLCLAQAYRLKMILPRMLNIICELAGVPRKNTLMNHNNVLDAVADYDRNRPEECVGYVNETHLTEEFN